MAPKDPQLLVCPYVIPSLPLKVCCSGPSESSLKIGIQQKSWCVTTKARLQEDCGLHIRKALLL